MRIWVADVQFYLARALRAVGVGMAAAAWASALSLQLQQTAEQRALVVVVAAGLGVLISQLFGGLPPSATPVDLLKPYQRDIVQAARDRAHGDPELQQLLTARIATLAVARLRRGANLPADRRAWLRSLARLAGGDD